MIYLWIADELNVDKYNEKDKQLYQVMDNIKTEGGIKTVSFTTGFSGKSLVEGIPEVEYAVAVLPASWFPLKGAVISNEAHLKAGGQYTSRDYFNAFAMTFTGGIKNRLFADKSPVAISKELAKLSNHKYQTINY